jgi:hypothetical protein
MFGVLSFKSRQKDVSGGIIIVRYFCFCAVVVLFGGRFGSRFPCGWAAKVWA